MPRINPQNNSNLNESPEASQNVRKLEKIKDSWYHDSPHKLFDLCIQVLVKNIDLILVKKKKVKHKPAAARKVSSGQIAADDDATDSKGKIVPLVSTIKNYEAGGGGGGGGTGDDAEQSLSAYRAPGSKSRQKTSRSKSPLKSKKLNNRVKYDLAEHVGPLPASICKAIITRYSQFYLSELGKLERDDYFQIMNAKTKSVNKVIESLDKEFLANPSQPTSKPSEPAVRPNQSCNAARRRKKLITHFDLLMTFASRSDKCSLNNLQYRQCMWAHSTLEQRLKARRLNRPDLNDADSNSNYFTSFSSSSSSDESESEAASEAGSDADNVSHYFDCVDASSTANMTIDQTNQTNNTSLERHGHSLPFKSLSTEVEKSAKSAKKEKEKAKKKKKPWTSLRSRQPEHLIDTDLRVFLRNHHIECLDICPCKLTNESISLINRHLSNKIKYLRFQNCCNWQLQNQQQPHQQGQQPNQPNGGNNVRGNFSNSDSDSDPDDFLDCHGNVSFYDDDDDDDDDEDDENGHDEHGGDRFRSNRVQQIKYDSNYLTIRNEFDQLMNDDMTGMSGSGDADDGYSNFDSNLKNFHEYFDNENINDDYDDKDEDDDEDDDDESDTYAFDAYLQDYISRYEQNQENSSSKDADEAKQQSMITYKEGRSSHRHHPSHRRRHHHCHRHRNKRDKDEDERMEEDRGHKSEHRHHHHHHHHHHHRHHHKRKRRARDVIDLDDYFEPDMEASNAECLLFKASRVKSSKSRRKSSRRKKHSLGSGRNKRCSKQSNSRKPTSSNTTMIKSLENNEQQKEGEERQEEENNSILKWFVKYAAAAASSKAALGLASTNSQQAHSSLNSTATTSSAATAAATAAGKSAANTTKAKSLIEQIKQKASLLTETKMIDKVSMTSSTHENECVETKSTASNSGICEGDCYSNQFSTDGLDADSMDFYYPKKISKTTSVSSSTSDYDEKFKANINNDQAYRRRRLMHLNEEHSIDSLSLTSSSCSSSLCAAHIGVVESPDENMARSASAPESFSSCCSSCCSTCDDDDDGDSEQEQMGMPFFSSAGSQSSDSASSSSSSSGSTNDGFDSKKSKRPSSKHDKKFKQGAGERARGNASRLSLQLHSNMLHSNRNFNNDADALDFNSNRKGSNLQLQLLRQSQQRNRNMNKRIRQQRLLEKVANLGSSPINVIQAIAAKALHFKLKNAVSFAEVAARADAESQSANGAAQGSNTSSRPMTSKAAAVLYNDNGNRVQHYGNMSNTTMAANRLLRQYKFLKSTNMTKKHYNGAYNSSQNQAASKLIDQDQVDSKATEVVREASSSINETTQQPTGQRVQSTSLIKSVNDEDLIPPLEDSAAATAAAAAPAEQPMYEFSNHEFKMPASDASAMNRAQIVVDVDVPGSSSSSSSSSDVYKKSTKRLKEDDNSAQPPPAEEESKQAAASSSGDVEMKDVNDNQSTIHAESSNADNSNLEGQQANSSNIPSNLFSVLKLWMSKRVDLLNSNSNNKSQQQQIGENSMAASGDNDGGNLQLRAISSITGDSTANENDSLAGGSTNSLVCQEQAGTSSQFGGGAQSTINAVEEDYDLIQLNKLKKQLRKFKKLAKISQKEADEQNNMALMNKKPASMQQVAKASSGKRSSLISTKHNAYYDDSFRYNRRVQVINLSMLQHLSLRNLGSDVIDRKMLNNLLKNFRCLKYLDISNCCTDSLSTPPAITNGLGIEGIPADAGLNGLICLAPSLTHLLMADLSVDDIHGNLRYILKLKQIRYLDISNCREKLPLNMYKNASLVLAKIAFHLSNLRSLDISGTNLGGPMIFKEADEIDYIQKRLYEDLVDEENDYQRVKYDRVDTIKSGVSGLMFLSNPTKKLDFFGCFCCDNSVSSRPNLPAIRIAGEETEKHLYTSLETYMQDRPLFLLDALNHLFELYKDESIEDKLLGGHLIMNTMEQHLDNSRIQISGSASLFYVIKHSKEENIQLPHFYLKRLIRTVINGMEEHIDESAMRRNCVLIMCRLNLPDDVLFVSDRLIKILLKIFDDYIEDRNKVTTNDNDRPENFVLRTAMHLLNILACSVHGNDKFSVGSQAIPIAMDLIRTKTRFNDHDEILEVTWSFLWNITDETPENCKIFLDYCDGMNAFMDCIKFKKPEITRNMMGLLGNVAEVKHLRNRLCKNEFINTFRDLLFQNTDGIEIPYNSAGVLVHIMSDGVNAWDQAECSLHDRANVIVDIETAIDKWNLESERNINYRSFEPIFRLVNEYENPICQRWACWALANLTTVYPDIYCPLFERENGHDILNKLLETEQVDSTIKKFAGIVLKNVENNLKK